MGALKIILSVIFSLITAAIATVVLSLAIKYLSITFIALFLASLILYNNYKTTKEMSGYFFVITGILLILLPFAFYIATTKATDLGGAIAGIIFTSFAAFGAILGIVILIIGYLLVRKKKR